MMANKRMFAMTIVDSDAFLNMPPSTQNLYFALGMRADDEGFINGPEKIVRICKAKRSDLEMLIELRFLIKFDSGIVCIKHWMMNNYIADARIKPTVYQDEKKQLEIKANKSYTERIQNADKKHASLDQCSVVEIRLDQNRLDEEAEKPKLAAEEIKRRMEEIRKKPFTEQLTKEEIEIVKQYDRLERGMK